MEKPVTPRLGDDRPSLSVWMRPGPSTSALFSTHFFSSILSIFQISPFSVLSSLPTRLNPVQLVPPSLPHPVSIRGLVQPVPLMATVLLLHTDRGKQDCSLFSMIEAHPSLQRISLQMTLS